MSENIVECVALMSRAEKAQLLAIYNRVVGPALGEVHAGTLPFVSRQVANEAMTVWRAVHTQTHVERTTKGIIEKLKPKAPTFQLWLDTRKVARWFGSNPAKGRILPGTAKRVATAGVQGSRYAQATKLVQPMICLKPLSKHKGMFEVHVAIEYRSAAVEWLTVNCR